MRLFVAVMVFLELVTGIARAIYLIAGDYPRPRLPQTQTWDIVHLLIGAALAFWGIVLLD